MISHYIVTLITALLIVLPAIVAIYYAEKYKKLKVEFLQHKVDVFNILEDKHIKVKAECNCGVISYTIINPKKQ
jgi:hypothetical protein